VTSQLQESIPASDAVMRFWEGRPDESTLRGALRLAWVTAALALVVCGTLFAAGWVSASWRKEMMPVIAGGAFGGAFLALYLFGIALVTNLMEKTLQNPAGPPAGWPRISLLKSLSTAWAVPAVRLALIVDCMCIFMVLCILGANWRPLELGWGWNTWVLVPALFLWAGGCAATSVLCAWLLVQSADERRRYHEEWARLPIEPRS
jgi:hypothetical protein